MNERLDGQSPAYGEETAPAASGERPLGLGGVLVAFLAGLAFAALLGSAGALMFEGSITVAFVLAELGLFVGVALYLSATGRRLEEWLRLGPVPVSTYPQAVKLGFALLLANFAATSLTGPPVRDIEFVAGAESTLDRVVLAVGVALLAPVIEEALFRGLLQKVLERRLRTWLAIAVAAMPFALLHGLTAALFFFFWSLPVGWITWRTRSIRPAVVVHAVNNLFGLVGLLVAGPIEVEAVERGVWLVVFAGGVLAIAVIWTVRLCRRIEGLVTPTL
jgi:membrane protease YdiL (CAAX protease family)